MKNIFIVSIISIVLNSCNIYSETKIITVSGLSKGKVVLSSRDTYKEFLVNKQSTLNISCNKGETSFVTFYPEFAYSYSRYPYGAIIDLEEDFLTVSPHLGLVTMLCNHFNLHKISINPERIQLLRDRILQCDDPWIYNPNDVMLFLQGVISLGAVSKRKEFLIPELNYLYHWCPENHLLNSWYVSIHSFYNRNNGNVLRLEIYDDGSYCCFEELN